jgi:Fe-S-cluster containining protein
MTPRRRLPVLVESVIGTTKEFQLRIGAQFIEGLRSVNAPLQCKEGCSFCCYHPFLITVSEGILLYRNLVEQGMWSARMRQVLEDHKSATMGLNYHAWLLSNLPCPLLDLKTKKCTVYNARPLHCRVTWSTGDPTECHPHALGSDTQLVGNTNTIVQYVRETQELLKRLGITGVLMPLSEAVVIGEMICTGKLPMEESDKQHIRNLYGS